MQASFNGLDVSSFKPDNKLEALELLNLELDFNWKEVSDLNNLKKIKIKNSLINYEHFISSICALKNLSELEIDWYCFFFNLKVPKHLRTLSSNIKEFNYLLPETFGINIFDTDSIKKNFITLFPNYEKIFKNLEIINLKNYTKKLNNEPYFRDASEILHDVNFYQLERLKNLQTINLCEDEKELVNNLNLNYKLLKLPNSKKILINNLKIQELKKDILNETIVCFDCDISKIADKTISIFEDKKINSKYYKLNYFNLSFEENLKKLNQNKIEHVIVNDLSRFLEANTEFYYIDTLFNNYLDSFKNLKTVTFNLTETSISPETENYFQENYETSFKSYFNDDNKFDVWDFDYRLFDHLPSCVENKKIKIKIKNCLSKPLSSYEGLHHLVFKIYYHQKFNLNFNFIIEDFEIKSVEDCFYNFLHNKLETVIILADDIKSKIINDLDDVEICKYYGHDQLLIGKAGLANNNKEAQSKDESLQFFLDCWTNTFYSASLPGNDEDPTICFIKNSFLQKNKNILFNNIKKIIFLGFRYDAKTDTVLPKISIEIPKGINLKMVKEIIVDEGTYLANLQDLSHFENIEKIYLNYAPSKNLSCRKLPKLNQLKFLKIKDSFTQEDGDVENELYGGFQNTKNLEDLSIDCSKKHNYAWDQWQTNDIAVDEIEKLTNLKKILLRLTVSHLKKIKLPPSLEEIYLQALTIDKEDGSFDGTVDKKPDAENYDFLKKCQNLKTLTLNFPSFTTISQSLDNYENIDFEKFFSGISKKITRLKIHIAFTSNCKKNIENLIIEIAKHIPDLKELEIYTKIKTEIVHDEKKKKSTCNFSKKTWNWNEKSPYDFELDFKIFLKLKNLIKLDFNFDQYDHINNGIINFNSILQNKKIESVSTNIANFKISELDKMYLTLTSAEDRFLYDVNMKKKTGIIDYKHQMTKADAAKFEKVNKEEVAARSITINRGDFWKFYLEQKRKLKKTKK